MTYIDGTGSSAATAQAQQQSATQSSSKNQLNSDAFLQLLVAQLKYQDPSNPADSTQFLAQTAQFQMVSDLEALQKQQDTMARAQQVIEGAAMVGRQVTYVYGDGSGTGTVTSAKVGTDGLTVTVNGQDIPIDAVNEISTPPVANTTVTPGAGSTGSTTTGSTTGSTTTTTTGATGTGTPTGATSA